MIIGFRALGSRVEPQGGWFRIQGLETQELGNLGDCQKYGPFLCPYYNTGPNTGPNLGDPKRDHNFDNPPPEVKPGV